MDAVSDLDGCYYVSLLGHTWAWTHILPTLITMSLSVASLRLHGYEWFPTIYGLYLHVWQFILWVFQAHWQIMRPHPQCAEIHTFAFPSQEAFYAVSLAAYILTYSYMWNIPLAIFTWLFIYCIVIVPPVVLVFLQYNRPWEIVVSMILGIVATVPFVLVIRIYIKPLIPYLLNQAPWCWFGYVDTYCCDKKEQRFTRYVAECVELAEKTIDARVHGRPIRMSPWDVYYRQPL